MGTCHVQAKKSGHAESVGMQWTAEGNFLGSIHFLQVIVNMFYVSICSTGCQHDTYNQKVTVKVETEIELLTLLAKV